MLSAALIGGCVATEASVDCSNDEMCQDGKFCNGREICNDLGKCEAGTPHICPDDQDDNTCTENLCDEISQGCKNAMVDFKPCELTTTPDYHNDICSKGKCISPGTCEDLSCNAPGPNFSIPLEDNLTAFYEISTDIGLVEDLKTGLEWRRCPQGFSGNNCKQSTGTAMTMSWKEALTACDELEWAGKDDWRLPSVYELRSIWRNFNIDANCDPNIDETAFPNTPEAAFWSASGFPPGIDHAYYISFIHGNALGALKDTAFYVRCTRGTPKLVADRFELIASGPIVKDRATGLIWQGCAQGQTDKTCEGTPVGANWSAAMDYCNNLVWAGMEDWRLPSLKELQSIVDGQRYNPAIDPTNFPNTPAEKFWSASEYRCYTDYALPVQFYDGSTNNENAKTNTYHVRCVKTDPDLQ